MRYKKISPFEEKAEEVKRPKWIRLLYVALIFLVFEAVYMTGLHFEWKPIVYIYAIAATLLFLAYFVINAGFENKPIPLDALPEAWDDDKKKRFAENDKKRKEIARKLMYFIIPLLLVIGIDIVYMAFFNK
ncbi:MAG: hypothetical protein IKT54_01410 [Clostridia bacterium]|jgi:membrane protein YdbS with pleckstrin-like domain|nr:hypothetical protein [Clostridia bacterium]